MKTIIKIFICLSLVYTPFFAFAGAAEKWDYEVDPIPDRNQRVVVTGHKVDQFGDPVNDSKYKTTIDPKTYSNKQKMGGVAISKLLKKANWAGVGVEAFQKLLEGIDWVIDPAAQSIWRYKKDSNGSTVGCTRTDGFTGKELQFVTGEINPVPIEPRSCPIDAANAIVDYLNRNFKDFSFSFYEWTNIPTPLKVGSRLDFTVKVIVHKENNRISYDNYTLRAEPAPENNTEREKEYLTPEAAADYANKTHPDYNNPAYKPKLDDNYKPEIVPNLWKPHNEWEKTNSPTAQEVVRQLEQANPTSENKDIEQKTDEQGNPTGSFSLPEFCAWATPVCDFFKWSKQNDELPDNESPEIVEHITPDLKEDAISWGSACPADVSIPISMQGVSSTLVFSWSPWCQLLSIIKPAIVASAYIGAAFIVLGLRT